MEFIQSSAFTVATLTGAYTLADGEQGRLTPLELGMLLFLHKHRERHVSRDELLENVWGYNARAQTRAVDSTFARLRRKVSPDGLPQMFVSAYRAGLRYVGHLVDTVDGAADEARLNPQSETIVTIEALETAWQSGAPGAEILGFPGTGRTAAIRAWLRRHPEFRVAWGSEGFGAGDGPSVLVSDSVSVEREEAVDFVIRVRLVPLPSARPVTQIHVRPWTREQTTLAVTEAVRRRWPNLPPLSRAQCGEIYLRSGGIMQLAHSAIEEIDWVKSGPMVDPLPPTWIAAATAALAELSEDVRLWISRLAVFEDGFSSEDIGSVWPSLVAEGLVAQRVLIRAGILTLAPTGRRPRFLLGRPWRRYAWEALPPSRACVDAHFEWATRFRLGSPFVLGQSTVSVVEWLGALRNAVAANDADKCRRVLASGGLVALRVTYLDSSIFDVERLRKAVAIADCPESTFRGRVLDKLIRNEGTNSLQFSIGYQSLRDEAPTLQTRAELSSFLIALSPVDIDYVQLIPDLSVWRDTDPPLVKCLSALARAKRALWLGDTDAALRHIGELSRRDIPEPLVVRVWALRIQRLGAVPPLESGDLETWPALDGTEDAIVLMASARALAAIRERGWAVAVRVLEPYLDRLLRVEGAGCFHIGLLQANCAWLAGDRTHAIELWNRLADRMGEIGAPVREAFVRLQRAFVLREPIPDALLNEMEWDKLLGGADYRLPMAVMGATLLAPGALRDLFVQQTRQLLPEATHEVTPAFAAFLEWWLDPTAESRARVERLTRAFDHIYPARAAILEMLMRSVTPGQPPT